MRAFGFAFAIVFIGFGTVVAQEEPDFALDFAGPLPCGDSLALVSDGEAAVVLDAPAEVDCLLTTSNNPGDVGAQGWSLSVASDNLDIAAITTSGTIAAPVAEGGLRVGTSFELSEVTSDADPGSACEGLGGAVSAVVLALIEDVTLPVESTEIVAKLTVEGGVFPAADPPLEEGDEPVTVGSSRLFFANGCIGSGEPVENSITWVGLTVTPTLGECAIDLVRQPPQPPPPECPGEFPVQMIAQSESTCETAELFAGQVPTPDPLLPGELEIQVPGSGGSGELAYAIVSDGLAKGPQGWSLALAFDGDASLDGATTAGTAAEPAADGDCGLRLGTSFELTEVIDPSNNGGQRGMVSAVVLALIEDVTLQATGTATVLALSVSGTPGQTATVSGQDGLIGSGEPVENTATIEGETVGFGCIQTVNVSFVEPAIGAFRSSDSNGDARIDIADPIYLINNLFREGPDFPCQESADANGDQLVDLSDATHVISYLFLGGPAPEGDLECHTSAQSTPESCPSGATACN